MALMSPMLKRPSPRAVFAALMALSLIALLLDAPVSDSLKHTLQPIVPALDGAYLMAHRAAAIARRFDANETERHGREAALARELAAVVGYAEALRAENVRLRSLRDNAVPLPLPVLPARVVARDMVAWRDGLLVQRGSLADVAPGDWVASRLFVNQGRAAGVRAGQPVIARECVLGRVEQVSPYMARVQLLSDAAAPRLEVRIGGRNDAGELELVDYPCVLSGEGRGRMRINGVPYQYIEEGPPPAEPPPTRRIRAGDLVLTAPETLGLPNPLVVGRVAEITEDPRKRLVYDLVVKPIVLPNELHDVFIIALVPFGPVPVPG